MARNDQQAIHRRQQKLNPLIVLLCSLAGAACYAVWASWRFSGDKLANQYLYVVPIVIPFVAFMLDRAGRGLAAGWIGVVIDVLVVGTAMMRVIGDVPFVSGHALFLIYAGLRPGSPVTRIAALTIWLEVLYLKFFVWHDLITPLTGIALGAGAAVIARRWALRRQRTVSTQRPANPISELR